jgi:hypothetical protein
VDFKSSLSPWAVGGTCAPAPGTGRFPESRSAGVLAGQSACPLGARGRSVSGMPPGVVATGRHFGERLPAGVLWQSGPRSNAFST